MKLNRTVKMAVAAALTGAPALVFATSIIPPASGPPPGTAAIPTGSGLVIEAWDPTLNVGMVEFLGPNWQAWAPGGSLATTSAGGATYDFGVLGGAAIWGNGGLFGASLSAGDAIDFAVLAGSTQTAGAFSIETTGPTTGLSTVRNSTVGTALTTAGGLQPSIGQLPTSPNPVTYTAGSATNTNAAFTFISGVGTRVANAFGVNVTGTVGGGALAFFIATQSSSVGTGTASVTPYTNGAGGMGNFSLSKTGDLVYSLPSAVPLPGGLWLLGSGLLGLAGIGRRRSQSQS